MKKILQNIRNIINSNNQHIKFTSCIIIPFILFKIYNLIYENKSDTHKSLTEKSSQSSQSDNIYVSPKGNNISSSDSNDDSTEESNDDSIEESNDDSIEESNNDSIEESNDVSTKESNDDSKIYSDKKYSRKRKRIFYNDDSTKESNDDSKIYSDKKSNRKCKRIFYGPDSLIDNNNQSIYSSTPAENLIKIKFIPKNHTPVIVIVDGSNIGMKRIKKVPIHLKNNNFIPLFSMLCISGSKSINDKVKKLSNDYDYIAVEILKKGEKELVTDKRISEGILKFMRLAKNNNIKIVVFTGDGNKELLTTRGDNGGINEHCIFTSIKKCVDIGVKITLIAPFKSMSSNYKSMKGLNTKNMDKRKREKIQRKRKRKIYNSE